MEQATSLPIDIGIPESQREEIATGLSRLLADTYTLYLKTHNYHWNVTGPMFTTLHTMFEEQYQELALAVDEIAERIRALGIFAPGSYSRFKELTQIDEETRVPSAQEMIQQLVLGQETVVRTPGRSSRSSKRPTTSPLPICSQIACKSMKKPPGC